MPTRRRGEKQQRRRRKRKRKRGPSERSIIRLAIFLRDDFRCCYCEAHLKHGPKGRITLDHVIPQSLEGRWCPENLVTACEFCNSQRGHQLLSVYASVEIRKRIFRQVNRPMEPYLFLAASMLARRRHAG